MSLFKSAATVGGYTTVSRILGFIRDQLVAFTLGTGGVAEAYFIAQRIPNLFRTLFAEGAFNAAFVPLFAKRVEGDGIESAHSFAHDVFSALLVWMVFFTSLAMIALSLGGFAIGAEGATIAFRPTLALAFSGIIVSVFVGILAGMAPAIQAATVPIVNALRQP